MSGTTTRGLPYPTGDDKVAEGDNAIRALAESIDALITGQIVKPTAVSTGGVINADGTVSFTAQNVIEVRGCFPAGTKFARVFISVEGTTVAGPGNFQFMQGTTPVATSYAFQRTDFTNVVTANQLTTGGTAVQIMNFSAGGGFVDLLVVNPGVASRKFFQARSGGIGTGQLSWGSCDNLAANFDGFKIYGWANAVNSVIRVQRHY